MALFFWKHSEDCLALALIACNIYADMITLLPKYDTERLALYEQYIRTFEQLAVQVIEECHSTDAEMARYLIETDSPLWGGFNCLNLAYRSARTEFIGTAACQSSLYFAWQHGIQSSTATFFLTAFLPFLLLSERSFEFHDKLALPIPEETKYSNKNHKQEATATTLTVAETEGVSNSASPISSGNEGDETEPDEDEVDMDVYFKGLSQSRRKLSFKYKLKIFYSAPKTKFFLSSLSYIAFLFLFSYVLMFRIEPDVISIEEAIVMNKFAGFLVESIRQIVQIPGSAKRKLKDWWSTYSWGKLDVFLLLFAIVSMFLRIGLESTYVYARTLYSITLIICYMKVYRLYAFHPQLGPETVMVRRMIGDLSRFLFILGLIFLSYGIAIQALLFPNRTTFDWTGFRDIFYYPYFQIWGELNLDYMFGQSSSCNGTSDGITCPVFNFVAPLLLCLFLLIVVILLINLLIAIFSNVYNNVQENAIQLWKFSMYAFVVEYNKKLTLAWPLSGIQALVELCIYLKKKCRQRRRDRSEHDMMEKANDERITASEEERLESDRDDGAQLFGFASNHREPPKIDIETTPKPRSLRDAVNLFSELKEANAKTAERDESTHLIRQFEMVCLRGVLNKQKKERAKSLPASIRLIGSKLDRINDELLTLSDKLEHAIRMQRQLTKGREPETSTPKEENSDRAENVSDRERKEPKSTTSAKGQEHTVPLPGQAQKMEYNEKEEAHSEPRITVLRNVPVHPLSLDLIFPNRDSRRDVQRTQVNDREHN